MIEEEGEKDQEEREGLKGQSCQHDGALVVLGCDERARHMIARTIQQVLVSMAPSKGLVMVFVGRSF